METKMKWNEKRFENYGKNETNIYVQYMFSADPYGFRYEQVHFECKRQLWNPSDY